VRGERLRIAFWNGRKLETSSFPTTGADLSGVACPIAVRPAWQAPLGDALARLRRPPVTPITPVTPGRESVCPRYCAESAGHEPGTPQFQQCLAGCAAQ
jgi:hypothetical protein